MANLTLRYLDELSYVLHYRKHISNQTKASSVGDLLNTEEERITQWITGEESAEYGRERRPPFVIPRITTYNRTCRLDSRRDQRLPEAFNHNIEPERRPSIKEIRGMFEARQQMEWSPVHEKPKLDFGKANSESPPLVRPTIKMFGSNENLLTRRPNFLPLKTGSGDNLNIEMRLPNELFSGRNRKSKSLLPSYGNNFRLPNHTIKEGVVNRTRLTENGKKVRKSWMHNYLVLTQNSLVFYKDRKAYVVCKAALQNGIPASPTGSNRPELVLSLHGALVSRCTPQHTSRYAKSCVVTTEQRDQLLLQDESPAGASDWYDNILQAINRLPSDYTCPNNNNINMDDFKNTPSPVRKNSPKNKPVKVGDSSTEELSDSTEHHNVRSKLKKFFTKRPTMDSLIKKGIYKDEPVFGRSLEEACPETSPRVPDFVIRCVRQIESSEENMTTDGLYRASGNLSQVQKIRLEVDQNNMSVIEDSIDIHVLTGSLKLFFRELKEPLIPCTVFHRILNASSNQKKEARTKEFKEIISSLPSCNRETLQYLLEHLLRVTDHQDSNRMHIHNLAIVFGPTLLWAPTESTHNIAAECLQQNHVIEILLTDFKEIFPQGPREQSPARRK